MKSPLRPATCATPEPTCRELNEEPSLGPESSPERAGRAAGFAVVPMEMARDRCLKARHFAVLLALYQHYNAKTNKPVYPSRRRLSELTGLHLSTVSAVTSELVALGWITKSGKGGFSKSTKYSLNIVPTPRPIATDATVVPQATLVTEAIRSPRHCGDTPSSPLSRLDSLASVATRKEQSKETEEKKNKIHEEVSAREKLARGLVEYFISSFQGLGTVTIPKDTSPVWKKWEDEFLSLLDAGAMYREIKTAISWLVDENRRRTEFRFIVTDPAELRKKWPKLLDAVSKDRADDILNFIDETPAETRVRRQRAYACDLLTVPTDDYEHEEDIDLGRLLDPRNRIPAPIAFCVCVEHGMIGGLHLEKEFIDAVRYDSKLRGVYKKVFPDLSQERVKELRLSEQGNHVDDVLRGADEQPQSPGPT